MTGFDLEENTSVQHQKNQKTNSCSIQYDWDTDKMRTVPVLCSWLLYAYAAMVWRELLMFLVYYNRRVSIKTPVQRKTSSWEQVVKSRLKCLVGALGKSSRAGGLFWPGAGSPELPSCATSQHSQGQRAAWSLFLGSWQCGAAQMHQTQSVQQENLPMCNESRLSEMNQFYNVDKKNHLYMQSRQLEHT